MSKETLDALDAAIKAHIADEAADTDPAGFVTAWVCVAALVPGAADDGGTTYWHAEPAGQPPHVAAGLLAIDTYHVVYEPDDEP